MSRSYKKAVIKDNQRAKKIDKRLASKRARKSDDLRNGGEYKKVYDSWNIADYIADLRFRRKTNIKGAKRNKGGWKIPK